MKKLSVTIELDLPALVDLSIAHLRLLHKEIRNGQGCDTNLIFVLHSAAERRQVECLLGFVPAENFGSIKATRLDFGACENFRFKWGHSSGEPIFERRCFSPTWDRRKGKG